MAGEFIPDAPPDAGKFIPDTEGQFIPDSQQAAIPASASPTQGQFIPDQPPRDQTEGPMPGFFRALGQGAVSGTGEAKQSIGAIEGQKPEAQPETSPASKPLEWGDVLSGDIFPKVGYRLGKSWPTVGAGVAGGLAGTAIAGPAGGLVGGTAGAAVGAAFQEVGPLFAEELKKSPSDPDGAWTRALHQAEISGAFSGAAWAAFPMRFFAGPLKQFAFQAFGVQPAISMAEQATQNYAQGKPLGENVLQAGAEGAVGTAVPMAGHETIRALLPKNVAPIQAPKPTSPIDPNTGLRELDYKALNQANPPQPEARATGWWKRMFQPEEVGKMAINAYPDFRQYMAGKAQAADSIFHEFSPAYYEFQKQYAQDPQGAVHFMMYAANEKATLPAGYAPPPQLARYLPEFKQLMNMVETADRTTGFEMGHRDDYFPRQFKDPDRAVNYFSIPRKNMPAPGFQKGRTLEYLADGLAQGMELVSNNPVDLVANRLTASAEAAERVNLLKRLNESELAGKLMNDGQKAQAVSNGWFPVKDPTGAEWALHPDLKPMWDNVVTTKGMWGNQGPVGNLFRGWMKLKNAYVPIKLALSLFHPLHVAHINVSNGLAEGWQKVKAGNISGAIGSAARGIYNPIAQGIYKLPTEAKAAKAAWLTPEWKQTPEQKQVVQLMKEGGFSPHLAEQLRTYDSRSFWNAWYNSDYLRMLPSGAKQALINTLQKPFFEHWIPSLKTAAYLDSARNLLERRPDLNNNDVARKAALTTIAKSIDNRYGEMFYNGLFWNKAVKDIGIGSFLSLGWNLGFAREFGGGLLEPYLRGVVDQANPARQGIQLAKNKTAFALTYMATAMALNAATTYYMTGGEWPEGYDYFLPRIGGTNPDGSPRRVTNMFYTREVPMLAKHMEEQQSYLGGIRSMLWNKMMLEPLVEFYNNRDYYGFNIMDESAPWYKQTQQALGYIFSDQLNPIMYTGAKRSLEAEGKWDTSGTWGAYVKNLGTIASSGEGLRSFAGFSPAPSYASKTEALNRLNSLFQKYVAPQERPQVERSNMEQRHEANLALDAAKKRGDSAAAAQAAATLRSLHAPVKKLGQDITMYQRLPWSVQVQFLKTLGREDFRHYYPKSNKNTYGDQEIHALAQKYYQQ